MPHQGRGFLCAQADLRKGKGAALMFAEDLQLSWLTAVLPPEVERLEAVVALRSEAMLGEFLLVDAVLTIEPGELRVHPPAEEMITLQHQGGRLEGQLDRARLAADLHLDIADDGLRGRLYLPRAALDEDPPCLRSRG